jgi:glutamate synthase (ferredoxin)
MSGGVAFVYDEYGTLPSRCNTDMVELKRPTERDFQTIRALIEEHARRTKSPRGIKMLYMFDDIKDKFVKVIPHEYEVALELTEAAEAAGKTHDEAIEIAFETMRNGR